MINGAHAVVYSHDPEADRAFFKGVLGLHHVDAGGGWLIFALPPAEVAVHPAEPGKPGHELFLMCRDIDAAVKKLAGKGVTVEPRVWVIRESQPSRHYAKEGNWWTRGCVSSPLGACWPVHNVLQQARTMS